MSKISKIIFQAGDINTFVLRGVISVIHISRKIRFSKEKENQGGICDMLFVEKLSKFNMAKS